MSQLLKVQLEDEDGNVYYLHTSGDSVFLDDGRTVQAAIEQTVRQSSISNVQVNDSSKVPSAALAYAMQQQITENEEAITGLNSDAIKQFNYTATVFDFDDPSYEAGMYRLGSATYLQNSPSEYMNYGNVLVVRNNGIDTLAMLAFTFNQRGIFFKSSNESSWADGEWDSFATKGDLYKSVSINSSTNGDLYKSVSINSSTNILTLLPGFYKFEGDTGTMLASNGFPFDNISYDNVSIFIWGDYTDENNGYKVIDLFYQGRRFVRRQSWNTWGEWKEYTLTTLT